MINGRCGQAGGHIWPGVALAPQKSCFWMSGQELHLDVIDGQQ